MKIALIGEKLGHSYSPQLHKKLGDYEYRLVPLPEEEVGEYLRRGEFDGLNVTIPYKRTVIPYLAELSPAAERIGAVNTIVWRNGKLRGENTDYDGFLYMLRRRGFDVSGKKVLVLGTGGAARTVCTVLRDERAGEIVSVSRTGENNYENITRHRDAAYIVNATPVGMYPNNGVSLLDLTRFPSLKGVMDLIYNPARTKLLLDAESLGIPGENGLSMLASQARRASELFTGREIADVDLEKVIRDTDRETENIVLIGMPGCGKTTVGRLLAEKLGRRFLDADEAFTEKFGVSPGDCIRDAGESAFRERETALLRELGKESGLVLATGGGCVTREENRALLRQNGKVIWLEQSPEKLAVAGRPLSQREGVEKLYRERFALYRHFADIRLSVGESAGETAERVKEAFFG